MMQMLKLADKNLKAAIINTFKDLKKKMTTKNDQTQTQQRNESFRKKWIF